MRGIELTSGLMALVDDEDYDALNQHSWYAFRSHCTHYAARSDHGHTIYMHRQLLDAQTGQEVDHANGDGLDNRRANLRFATRQQNQQNRRPRGMYKGVSYHAREQAWRARIKYNGRFIELGHYPTAEMAAREYDRYAPILFGEFARCNFGGAHEAQA